MVALLYGILKTARPRQWLKNLAVFAPLVFSGWLFDPTKFPLAVWAFFIFCLLSSSVYFINDILDRKQDQKHPFKRLRPIASGVVSPTLAGVLALIMICIAIWLSFQFNLSFTVAVFAYILLQLAYSLFIKHIILLDVMTIAAGFLIRVYAGSFIIHAHADVWFLLAVLSSSLFMAIGKRRSELTILHGHDLASQHRATLQHYPETLLDSLTTMFATAAWVTYGLFTFNYPTPRPTDLVNLFIANFLPQTIEQSKWLMISVPFVIYGVMRYLYVIYEKKEGESPERILLSDKPMLFCVILWGLSVLIAIYGIQAA